MSNIELASTEHNNNHNRNHNHTCNHNNSFIEVSVYLGFAINWGHNKKVKLCTIK